MSTKDNLINMGLLAAGGVAIAAPSGVYSKGSRATTWEPKGDDFRRADVAYPDEVEVLYVSELRMYLPYVKLGDHVLSFDAALPLARAKTEASQAYDAQRNYNDYVGRNPYSKSRSKS
jgi:hypothetical protein